MAKITKAEMPALAEQIVKCLGGKENVARINHCATRLRVNPVDMEKVDKDGLKRLHGVIGIDSSKAELQIIVGAIIEDLYLEVEKITGNGGGAVADDVPFWKKRPSEIFSSFLLLMAGCLSPVIPALIASGLLATVLTIMTLVLHVDASTSSTYSILYNLSQTVFYFMPVLVAYTSAKKFGTEPVLAMVLACFLLYPDWVAGADGSFTHYFGLPVLHTTYNGAVIQIILSVFVMSLLDKWLKKVIPEAARHFVKPFTLLLLMSVITLTVTGPLGGLLTNYIYAFVEAVRSVAPWAGVPVIVLLSTTIGLIAPGFHLALIPIATASLAAVGYDDLINIWFFCCTITPGFVALAVMLRTKKSLLRQTAFLLLPVRSAGRYLRAYHLRHLLQDGPPLLRIPDHRSVHRCAGRSAAPEVLRLRRLLPDQHPAVPRTQPGLCKLPQCSAAGRLYAHHELHHRQPDRLR